MKNKPSIEHLEPIKIHLKTNIYDRLRADAYAFNIRNKDNTANMNELYNLILFNHILDLETNIYRFRGEIIKYKDLISDNDKYDESKKIIDHKRLNSVNTMADIIFFNMNSMLNSSKEDDKVITRIRIERDKERKYLEFREKFSVVKTSSFFNTIFNSYLSLPEYKRELVLFNDEYNYIKKNIRRKLKITYCAGTNANNRVLKEEIINPYKLVCKGGNYLLGVIEKQPINEVVSIKLRNIKSVEKLPDNKIEFKEQDLNRLVAMTENNPKYAFGTQKLINIGITFDEKYFNNVAIEDKLNTPHIISKRKIGNDLLLQFDCTIQQAYMFVIDKIDKCDISGPQELINLVENYTSILNDDRINRSTSKLLDVGNDDFIEKSIEELLMNI